MEDSSKHPCITDFEVIDESEDWIVVNKPAPLIVHPTDNKGQATLLCGVEQLLSYELTNGAKLSIINRLDRETSGIVIIAKNKTWARYFNRAIERRLFKKSYLAIIEGTPDWSSIQVNAPITNQRDVKESKIWLKQMVHESGKESITDYEVINSNDTYSLVKVTPKTGRMHQIRVHAAHLGHPLVGDKIYGKNEDFYLQHIEHGWTKEMEKLLPLRRQALHAFSMELDYDGHLFQWEAPMPEDMKRLISL